MTIVGSYKISNKHVNVTNIESAHGIMVLLNFLVTVEAAPNGCVIRTGLP